MDRLAARYQDRVAFVAPAWKAGLPETSRRAAELLPGGLVKWGLDEEQGIFSAFGVGYQPVTVLVGADRTIVKQLFGAQGPAGIEAAIEELLSVAG